jgi:CDP-diacylglycerol--serine O-phosphatidyltransferase
MMDNLNKKNKDQRGFYLLPNLFTTAALFFGFFSILNAMNGKFEFAALCIFFALVMDGLDGRVARLTNTESKFGAEYDSLSDMVSFGVAPALVMYIWALKPLGKIGWIGAFIYCACAGFRLARFNTKLDIPEKKYFYGLPSPAAAALVAAFIWVCIENGVSGNDIFFNYFQMKWFGWIMIIIAALSMVTDVKYYSGKDINLRNSVPSVSILLIVLAFSMLSHSPAELIFIALIIYLFSGYVNFFKENFKLEKSKKKK